MKQRLIILAVLTSLVNMTASVHAFPKTSLSGKIISKKTGESLTGVTVYITDLKTGDITDINGHYKIENLPQSKIFIQVNFIGYKTIVETVDLTSISTRDFALEESVTEMHEVVVTGLSQAAEKNRTPTPISTIPQKQLLQTSATNIIDAIALQPGVSQVTTGSGISKPVIRGLGYNRVVVVNDGIRQEGQQWGDEHGIEVDEFAVNHVEILKGPASLSYGSDAMAGVVNLLSAQSLPDGKIKANLLGEYQTNNGLVGGSGNIAGNIKGFVWDVRYSNKQAHAYQNKYDGYVFNSGYKEGNVSGIIGLNKSWGYSHLHFSVYNLTPGIVEGERDSATGQFVKPIAVNDSTEGTVIANDKDFLSYTASVPFQKIYHYKAVLNNSFVIGNGSLKTTLGFQQNQRQEYGDVLHPNQYGLYFLLNTINYDVHYLFPEKNKFNVSIGANGMQQTSQNKGSEFLVPQYNLFDIGGFVIVKKSFDKLDISGGVRYDARIEHGDELFLDANEVIVNANTPDATQKFVKFNSTFNGISGSIGAAYQISERVFTKLNVSRGFRAPNIAEVGANGVHDGTIRYELGDPKLKAENSIQYDFAIGLNSNHVQAEIDLFYNDISNFIFSTKLINVSGGDSITDGYQTFKFVAGHAQLYGGEVSIDIHPHPLDWLHFENSFSYVQATQKNQPDSTTYLPFTPAPKLTSELRADLNKVSKTFTNAYVKVGIENYITQDNYYRAYGTETRTPGYTLFNAGAGTDVMSKNKTLFSIFLSVTNLTDVAYQSHLSRLKYGAVNNVTGRTGVYNMGRNVSVKLLVPLDFSKRKISSQ